MKILCADTGAESRDILEALVRLGFQAELYGRPQEFSIVSIEEIELLAEYVRANEITHLMSTHLIYNLSVAAAITEIKYIAIIWDAPYDKLFTPYGRTENCWFSTFDKVDAGRFQKAGLAHVLYQPIVVNSHAIGKWQASGKLSGDYYNDVCFIGSLYDQNAYDRELGQMPEIMKRYFSSMFEKAAFRWDGVDRIFGKTDSDMVRYLQMTVPTFSLGNSLDIEDRELFDNMYLTRKLANIERIGVLNLLAEYFRVTCCTYSRDVTEKLKGVRVLPQIEEGEAFAIMAARSKINLNISLKGIRMGTPKRVMDIMGAGGFVMTSYCVETAELFEEGREIEMFRSPEELVEKTAYYLEHAKERKEIARAGQQKVLRDFTYEKGLKQLLDWVEDGQIGD